jgi:hypothetical protein
MKLTITDKVFVPVSVDVELPECDSQHNRCYLSKRVGILSDEGIDSTQYYKEYSKDGNFKSQGWSNEEDFSIITHWLKEETNKYVLSREELEKVINDAFNAGELHNENKNDIFYTEASTYFKDFKQYINSILNNAD